MKTIFVTILLFFFAAAHAAENLELQAVTAADNARVAAMVSADAPGLRKTLSAELRYAHSNGVIDTKESLIGIITGGRTRYAAIDYQERQFSFPAQDLALMTGRARVQVTSPNGPVDAVMSFLGVWRKEGGEWRFLAWQSCKLPVANPPK